MTEPLPIRDVLAVMAIQPDGVDGLIELLADEGRDPEFRAAYEDAEARMAFLRSLIAMRKAKGISQAVVAEAMGTTQSHVSDLEAGGTDPRLSTLQRYARAVGCRMTVSYHGTTDHG